MRDPQHAARLFRERRPRNGEGDQSGDTRKTGKPVSPMTLARAFARELESGATEFHTLVGNFILCAILGKKPALGEAIKKRTGPHDRGDLLRQNQDGLERDGGERAGQQGRQTVSR